MHGKSHFLLRTPPQSKRNRLSLIARRASLHNREFHRRSCRIIGKLLFQLNHGGNFFPVNRRDNIASYTAWAAPEPSVTLET